MTSRPEKVGGRVDDRQSGCRAQRREEQGAGKVVGGGYRNELSSLKFSSAFIFESQDVDFQKINQF